jgi:transmembrane sensor
MSRASDISDAAAQWLVRLEGQTTPEIWDAFQEWMDQNPRHRAEFIRLREAWKSVDKLKIMRPMDGTIDADLLATTKINPSTIEASGPRPIAGTQRRNPEELPMPERRRVFAIAAAIAAAGILAWFSSYHLGWKQYETGVGGREKRELADGSTVDLNTNTELNVRISSSRRDIMLSRGEALFHVAHDANRPFYVTAGGTVVRAVGTEFSVRIRDPEHVDVLVAEGKVAVGAPGTDANFENPSLLATAPKVSAGEAASVRPKSVDIHPMLTDDVTRKLRWTTGFITFQGESLSDAVQEFNRYNDRQIRIADQSIVEVKVGGNFRVTDVDSFTAALQHNYGFKVQVGDKDGEIRLIAGARPP